MYRLTFRKNISSFQTVFLQDEYTQQEKIDFSFDRDGWSNKIIFSLTLMPVILE